MVPPFSFLWVLVTSLNVESVVRRALLNKTKKETMKKKENIENCARTFSLQLLSMEIMERQTDCTDNAGDQSSVSIDKQM